MCTFCGRYFYRELAYFRVCCQPDSRNLHAKKLIYGFIIIIIRKQYDKKCSIVQKMMQICLSDEQEHWVTNIFSCHKVGSTLSTVGEQMPCILEEIQIICGRQSQQLDAQVLEATFPREICFDRMKNVCHQHMNFVRHPTDAIERGKKHSMDCHQNVLKKGSKSRRNQN